MEYITTENNLVTSHLCGPEPEQKDGVIVIEVANWTGSVGDDIRSYEEVATGRLKPLKQRLKEKIVVIPKGKKVSQDGCSFVDMSDFEQCKSGIKTLPKDKKIKSGAVVFKNDDELLKENLISQKEYIRRRNERLKREIIELETKLIRPIAAILLEQNVPENKKILLRYTNHIDEKRKTVQSEIL